MEVEIGKVAGTHGIKGEIKIYSQSDFIDERLAPGHQIRLELMGKSQLLTIASHRVHKNMELVKFEGLDSINDVEWLKGAVVYAEQTDELDEGEYYYKDLIGCQVEDEAGQVLGHIISILEMPTQDVLEIEDEKGTFMVPYVDAFVVEEDIEHGRMVLSLIEGMRP